MSARIAGVVAASVVGMAVLLTFLLNRSENPADRLPPPAAIYENTWSNQETSQVRFVATGRDTGDPTKWLVGLQMKLADGWKTYWRVPGDSGLAPQFDWSGSDNVAEVQVAWPAPRIFEEMGERFYGYKEETVWPMRVTPHDPEKAVTLQLRLGYGVCSDVCVPVAATLAFGPLEPTADFNSPFEGQLEAALANQIRNADAEGISTAVSVLEVDSYEARLKVDVANAPAGSIHALVVEGPEGHYFSRSEQLNEGVFSVSVEADDPAALAGTPVRITMLNTDGTLALETITQIQ